MESMKRFKLTSDPAWIGIRMYGVQGHVECFLSRPRTTQLLQDGIGLEVPEKSPCQGGFPAAAWL